jgi:hypothetical protein
MKIDPSLLQSYGIEKAEEIEELVSEAFRGAALMTFQHRRVKITTVTFKITVDDTIELELVQKV